MNHDQHAPAIRCITLAAIFLIPSEYRGLFGFDIQLAPPMKMVGRSSPAELSKRAEDLRHLLPFLVTLRLCKTAGVGIPCVSDAPKVMSDCPHVDEE